MSRPIATINPLVGDASFIARHGRLPTPADDDTERIATHLAFAERVLRAVTVTRAQQAARAELLGVLRRYIAARRYPLPETTRGRLPAFIDREGTRCAVAALVDHAAGAAASTRIDARCHDAFVADIEDDALAILAAEAGLTRAELALIQPSYGSPPPPPIVWQADATTETAAASGASDDLTRELLGVGVRWEGRHSSYIGDPIVALDANVGADTRGDVPYAAEARIGTEMLWGADGNRAHRSGILAGVRLDAEGSRVPQAWTIPVDGYWYLPWPDDHGPHLGVVGSVRMRFAGADRALGWTAGFDVERSRLWFLGNRDLHVGVGVEHLAPLTFVAVTIGVSSRGRYDAWGRDW